MVKIFEPGGQPLPSLRRRGAGFITDVIAVPHECVHRAQSVPLVAGQHQKTIVEIFRCSPGDTAAYRIRRRELGLRNRAGLDLETAAHFLSPRSFPNAARATSASLRVLEITGRRRSTSNPWRSMAF